MKQNEPSIKRYDLLIASENWGERESYYIVNEEYPDGKWVKWEDVEELIDKLRSWEIYNDSFHNDLASLTTSYYNSSPK